MEEPWNPDESDTRRRRPGLGPAVIVLASVTLYWMMTRPAPALEGWNTSYHAALSEAASTHRKVLLAFHMQGCPPCTQMSRTVLETAEVKEALKPFVPVHIDAQRDGGIAEQFGVRGTPTYVVADADGTPLSQTAGYLPSEFFIEFLRQASSISRPPDARAHPPTTDP